MTDDLLIAYDEQLRGRRELDGADRIEEVGPVWTGVFPGGNGFVGYRDLGALDAQGIRRLVAEVTARFESMPDVEGFEWKTRGHDRAPGLEEALIDRGFIADEPESVMVGEATGLVGPVPPDGVLLRRVRERDDVFAMERMQGVVFGDPRWVSRAQRTVDLLARGADVELWVAEVGGTIVSAGRLEPVTGTTFAGLWGGATLEEWRGRGIYRALTARRAQAALDRGLRYLQSDSTELSRPILERSGMRRITTTTPFNKRRN